jgi:pseudouridine synthase
MKIVLQKFIAENEPYSRRQAEGLIRDGVVKVNGKIAALGERVDENDVVLLWGKKIKVVENKPMIYLILNKPTGYTCTTRNFKDEKNVFDLIETTERLFIVGRLDKDSQGLVLLTNDGDLAQKMTHPKFGCEKVYEVDISHGEGERGFNPPEIIKKFKNGINLGEEDGVVWAQEVKYTGNNIFKIVLNQGKKRQIRRMFGALGYDVLNLKRVGIGSLVLGDLKLGASRELREEEIKKLKISK